MKKLVALLMTIALLLACAACGGEVDNKNTSTESATTQTTAATASSTGLIPTSETPQQQSTASIGTQTQSKPSTAPTSTTKSTSRVTRPDITMSREAKKDGLVLKVFTGYQHQYTGEPFTLTVSITNTTEHDIIYGADNTPNLHSEIKVRIAGKGNDQFTDMDVWGKLSLLNYRYATLKAGETYTQTMRFLPGAPLGNPRTELSEQDIDLFPAGEYEGTAVFTYYAGSKENPGEAKLLELKFPVILV